MIKPTEAGQYKHKISHGYDRKNLTRQLQIIPVVPTAFVVYDLSEILFFTQGFVTFERKSRPPVSAVHSGSGLL